jgi:hypothetical protein
LNVLIYPKALLANGFKNLQTNQNVNCLNR